MWIVSVQRGRTRKWNRILGPSETQAQLDLGAIFVYAVHVGSLFFPHRMASRKVVRVVVGLAAGTLLTVKAFPHIYPHEYVKRLMELKVNSTEMQVPDRCREQLERIAPKIGVNQSEKITFFVSKSLFPMSAGATWLPNGAVIGVPLSFFFKQEQDIARFRQITNMNSGKGPLDLEGKIGAKLKDTLIMSDDNVAFLIGHELSHIKCVDLAPQILLAPSWLYVTFEIANSTRRVIPRASVFVDGIIKISVCFLSYLCYWKAQRYLNHYQEFKADEMCARSDLNVAEGGADWMLKTINFNSFMRLLHERGTTRPQSPQRKASEGYTHPKLLDRLRKVEVIVDQMMKGALY